MSDVARAYDRWSASYDTDANATRDLDALVLQGAGLPLAGKQVLELGCGTGKNTRWLARHAASVLALDFSPGMLARAQAALTSTALPGTALHGEARADVRLADVQFMVHDITTPWPADDASMDVVVGNLVLEHVADLTPVFTNAARVLREHGTLYLCELHPYRQLRGGQAHFTDAESGETTLVPAYTHSVSEYVNGGIDAGLTLVRVGEWLEEEASPNAAPRLLSVTFRRERR